MKINKILYRLIIVWWIFDMLNVNLTLLNWLLNDSNGINTVVWFVILMLSEAWLLEGDK